MAHRRSSIKKIRVDKRRRERNQRVLSELRTLTRRVRTLLGSRKAPEAAQAARLAFSKLDKAVKKGLLHKKNASRQKSRIQLQINRLVG